MRHTRAHTANRRSHHAIKGARFETCAKCGAKHLMHRACAQCGTYRGRTVIDVMKKVEKKAAKLAAKKGESAPKEKKAKAEKTAKAESTEPKKKPAKKKE